MTPYYRAGEPCIDVTTGLGYPKKANDAQANPLVSLLFSDPTGCGLTDPPTVLVQGSADVDDRDLEANRERYAREATEKLPALNGRRVPERVQRLFGWYFTRIYIHVRPERVYVWRTANSGRTRAVTTRTWRRSAPATPRSPTVSTPHPEGGAIEWDARLERARHDLPDRGALDRLSRRLPVRHARSGPRSTRPTAGSGSRTRPPARRCGPGWPA